MILNKKTILRVHNAIYCSDITLSTNRWGSQAFAMLSYLSYIVFDVRGRVGGGGEEEIE